MMKEWKPTSSYSLSLSLLGRALVIINQGGTIKHDRRVERLDGELHLVFGMLEIYLTPRSTLKLEELNHGTPA